MVLGTVIKAILAMKYSQIPKHLHFTTPNPRIPWHNLPFQVVTESTPWPDEQKRIAAVSNFGMSGTNAHLILEAGQESNSALSAVPPVEVATTAQWQVLPLSAKSATALQALAHSYLDWLDRHSADLFDICATAAQGPSHFAHRAAIVANTRHAQEVQQLFGQLEADMPPLAGIFHLAGSIRDRALHQLSWSDCSDIMASKVLGAWHLHQHGMQHPLEWFVLFSSVAGVLGQPGQANYAAANAFLDQLAEHRRALGLCALAIDWGGWAESGMAAELDPAAKMQLAASGMAWLDPEHALAAMGDLLGRQAIRAAVIKADWAVYARRFPQARRLLQEVLPERVDAAPTKMQPTDRVAELLALPSKRRLDYLQHYLTQQLQDILRSTDLPEVDQVFLHLGFDSLMSTQLVARLRDELRVKLPLELMLSATITSLAHNILEQLPQEPLASTEVEVALPPILPQPADAPWVISHAQQRVWFLTQLEGAASSYNLPYVRRLTGPLDIEVLRATFIALVTRHQNLRLTFPAIDGQPQVRPIPVYDPLTVVDLRHLTLPDQQEEIDRRAVEHGARPFDLAQGPLWRMELLWLADQSFLLLSNMHHIISDGWSMAVLIRDWQAIYSALSQQRSPDLSPLEVQYSDFAHWQQQWLQQGVLQQQLAYWQEQLAGVPAQISLPLDYPRPAQQSYDGVRHGRMLSPALTHGLKRLSQAQGVTLFMTLMAAFNLLLARYSGQDDICIGTPIANRRQRQTEDLIGFFVNTLVLRTPIPRAEHALDFHALDFIDLLQRTRATCLAAYDHQDIPFEIVVEHLQPERSLSHSPLFQVMFALQHSDTQAVQLPGLQVTLLEQGYVPALFDLTLIVTEHAETLHCAWDYPPALFAAPTIQRLAEHFELLLQAVVADPHLALDQWPWLTPADQAQLQHWNRTEVAYPQGLRLIDPFEQQVEMTPQAIALIFADQQLSYRQLNQRANQLAHKLLAHSDLSASVAPRIIAIATERSVEMVVGLLAILKSGSAYLPIDPEYPTERIRYMLEESAAPICLTQRHLCDRLPMAELVHDCQLLCIDDLDFDDLDTGDLDTRSGATANPPPSSRPEDVAYVIYTSGSTGQPKGVMNTHQGIVNRLQWMQETFPLTAADRVLQKTPFSFDVSVWEFFWPLWTGAALVVAKPEGHKDPVYLAELIRSQQISLLHFVPSMLQAFLPYADATNCRSIRHIICSGEALGIELVRRFVQRFAQGPAQTHKAQLHNLYGPTEAAIDVSHWPCQLSADTHTVPIGRPIANTQLHVLDDQQRPLPIGVPGELYIGGIQVAKGYLHKPQLTAAAFLDITLYGQPQRLYRSGACTAATLGTRSYRRQCPGPLYTTEILDRCKVLIYHCIRLTDRNKNQIVTEL